MKGNLYLIATPIGNVSDISARVIETLKMVDVLYAEDTRETKKLLSFYEMKKSIKCLNDHNEASLSDKIIEELSLGHNIGIVSDRGTPLISDPGYKVVKMVRDAGYTITSIPGPVAFINALIASGLPTDKFVFMGFVKYKKKLLLDYSKISATLIFYESPKRIAKLIDYLLLELGDREVVIARELTKKFETFYTGYLSNILEQKIEYKGEFVVLVGPPISSESFDVEKLVEKYSALEHKKLIELLLQEKYKLSKNELYNYLYRKE